MFAYDVIKNRLQKGRETFAYPRGEAPKLPDRHGGAPIFTKASCDPTCSACVGVCPTSCITRDMRRAVLDLGRCVFCGDCVEACSEGVLAHSADHRMATSTLADLVIGGEGNDQLRLANSLGDKLKKLLGRSLKLRQVSAGGCNACELDVNVLSTIGWDLSRFGVQFVASPRHADGVLITGPVSNNMKLALEKTWAAIPAPKIALAVGACAISGGLFAGSGAVSGVPAAIPIDLFIPGCPPHPLTILDGLLRIIGKKLE